MKAERKKIREEHTKHMQELFHIMVKAEEFSNKQMENTKLIWSNESKKSKLEKRISKLESKVEVLMNPVNTSLDSTITDNNNELTELPEKWCVKVTRENQWILTKWKKEISKGLFDDVSDRYEYIQYDGAGASYLHEGYTEISFSAFERLVLKKEEFLEEFETGKWYKLKNNTQGLVYYKGTYGNYGFHTNGEYTDNLVVKNTEKWRIATNKEVEEALKNEAKKRGFKKGVVINAANNDNNPRALNCKLDSDNFTYMIDSLHGYTNEKDWCNSNSNPVIFSNGKWAEISQGNNDEIDWSIPGQKVIGNQEVTVLTSGDFDLSKEIFSGIIIKTGGFVFPVGYYSKNWDLKHFKLHTNPVTL